MSTKRKPLEAVSGSYTPVPHAVLDCVAFVGASSRAKAMLFELLRQHTGKNNGRLQLAVSWLKRRGWSSVRAIQSAKEELLARRLVIKTRLGGLSVGPDWYALTWVPISNYTGLELKPGTYYPGLWRSMDVMPTVKSLGACSSVRNDEKRDAHSHCGNSAVPPVGMGDTSTIPPVGTKTAIFDTSPVPTVGNNECCQLPPFKSRSRVVGKKGRSGVAGAGGPVAAINHDSEARKDL